MNIFRIHRNLNKTFRFFLEKGSQYLCLREMRYKPLSCSLDNSEIVLNMSSTLVFFTIMKPKETILDLLVISGYIRNF
jgi:hypothetical protein